MLVLLGAGLALDWQVKMANPWDPWPDPVHAGYRKHLPLRGNVSWEQQVKTTANAKPCARYKPGIAVEELEMKCARHEGSFLIYCDHVTRVTAMICEENVGASRGEETAIIRTEHSVSNGATHGRPITKHELCAELRKHNLPLFEEHC